MNLFRTTYVFISGQDSISVSFFDIGLRISVENYSGGDCAECEWETKIVSELEDDLHTNPRNFISSLRNMIHCQKYSEHDRDCVLAALERGFSS